MFPEYPKALELLHKDMDAIACEIAVLKRDDPRRPDLIQEIHRLCALARRLKQPQRDQ